jgi:catechol 2,3-dioxygenase-like lactoylglutathione lyase family enzyme
MKSSLLGIVVLMSICVWAQQSAPARPKITGIDHVAFYTTLPEANRHLYADVLGLASAPALEPGQTMRFLAGIQWVGYGPAPDAKATDRMDHVALRTEDCAALRVYLAANGISVPKSIKKSKDGSRSFVIKDPEGHVIEFVEAPRGIVGPTKVQVEKNSKRDPISARMIHAGFIVHDRAAEDHFYKDILGFRLYWYGGMKAERTDWVAMQVPDGTDWLEYMLNQPMDADLRLTGVMNHISLGVKDMKAAQAKLEARGWKANDREHSQMGRDGKWQLNVYDPDQTRIELMEFTPAEKPCCSEFQGPHPSEP